MNESKHIVLLGDSIFDNKAYVGGGPDVIYQVRAELGENASATLLAVDGDCAGDVAAQLKNLPAGATHLVVSVGGNDALGQAGILREGAHSVAEAVERLAQVSERFENAYREMLQAVIAHNLPAAVCTIYYPRFSSSIEQRLTSTALTHFNDVILRNAFAAAIPVLDLRLICSADADYANEIEPSSAGGAKIAQRITRLVADHDFAQKRSAIFA